MRRLMLLVAAALAAGCGSAGPAGPGPLSFPSCPDGALELLGEGAVARPVARVIVVRPSREIAADPQAMRAHIEAAAEVTAAAGGAIELRVSSDEDADAILFSSIDPALGSAGGAIQQGAPRVASGSILFQSAYYAGRRPIITHEMLHWLGVQNHSSTPGDIMYTGPADPNRGISPREVAVLRYLLTVPPGTLPCR